MRVLSHVHPDGYSLIQFRVVPRRYERVRNPSMRMEYKAKDKLVVDYTGAKLWIYPPGEQPREVEVFVAILGCSLLTYVEGYESQRRENFITACENEFCYYGGVPRAIVSDNLRSVVSKASRYEVILNTELTKFSLGHPNRFDGIRLGVGSACTTFLRPAGVHHQKEDGPNQFVSHLVYREWDNRKNRAVE